MPATGRVHLPALSLDEALLSFALPGLLPLSRVLALRARLGVLCLLTCGPDGRPQLVAAEQFTATECSLLVPLLDASPNVCPYEVLAACFATGNGRVSEPQVARYRARLDEARAAGLWDQELRPVRRVVNSTRRKLRALGIAIATIVEVGAALLPLAEDRRGGAAIPGGGPDP